MGLFQNGYLQKTDNPAVSYPDQALHLGNFNFDWLKNIKNLSNANTGILGSAKTLKQTGSNPLDLLNLFKNLSGGEAFDLQFKQNPWGITAGLASAGLDTIGSIWNGIQQYRTAKDAMNLARDDYNLRKEMYEANEARNKEKFDWLRQARSTSQL